MTALEFGRFTPRELEDMVTGAIMHYHLQRQILMEHAWMTGQWKDRPQLLDLLGHDPLPLDAREKPGPPVDPLVEERMARTRAMMAEAEAHAYTPQRIAPVQTHDEAGR